jgi:hypothetical protein
MPKKIITSPKRLQKYSKAVLIELVLELRDRFNETAEQSRHAADQMLALSKALRTAKYDLHQARKRSRQLMKQKGGLA